MTTTADADQILDELGVPRPATTEPRPLGRARLLPADFWEARRVLRHIRQAAHARYRSGDVVLGGVFARLSALLPPTLKADTGVGTPASINMFVALVGPSGSGKTTGAAWIPSRLIPAPPGLDFADGLPLGSGEGLAEAFMGTEERETGETIKGGPNKGQPKTEKVRAKVRDNALFYADEGESLIKQLSGRNGATIGESLRRAWTGGTIGQFNGREITTRVVETGTYSLGLAIGFQPETALPLLTDEAAKGTPQRFLWLSTLDPSIPPDGIEEPGPLDLPLLKYGFGTDPAFRFAGEVLKEIQRDEYQRAIGTENLPLLDAHKPLMKVKLAALLATLANATDVTAEDWQLADAIWTTSCAVRDHLLELGERQRSKQAEERTRQHVDRTVRAHAATTAADRSIQRVARRLAKLVTAAGAMTPGALRKDLASRDRPLFSAAVDYAEASGWVAADGDKITPRDSMPS